MKKTAQQKRQRTTRFTCHAPDAKAVFLAGTFNGWNTLETPMSKEADGTWSVGLELKPGRFEYKFLVDGAWCCGAGHDGDHPGCAECVPNPFGTKNRVLEVT